MRQDNFYAFYFSYQTQATGNVEAMLANRGLIEDCNNFVNRPGSQVGFRLHIVNEVIEGKVTIRFTFYMRTDCSDLRYQLICILDFAVEHHLNLDRIAIAKDEEL